VNRYYSNAYGRFMPPDPTWQVVALPIRQAGICAAFSFCRSFIFLACSTPAVRQILPPPIIVRAVMPASLQAAGTILPWSTSTSTCRSFVRSPPARMFSLAFPGPFLSSSLFLGLVQRSPVRSAHLSSIFRFTTDGFTLKEFLACKVIILSGNLGRCDPEGTIWVCPREAESIP
jgi:hypothetical protein